MILEIVLFVIGLMLLWLGSETLVNGSSSFAVRLGIRPLIVGLTVVAMGTSSPELAVSLLAALRESTAISIGNIIGSNIANIGLVVGFCALLRPLHIERRTLRREVPVMVLAVILLTVFAFDGMITKIDGILLFAFFIVFLLLTIRNARVDERIAREKEDFLPVKTEKRQVTKDMLLIIAGLAMLLGGSYLLVQSAVVLAKALGVSEAIIAISLIAIGTSLPELAISSVSTLRGKIDLAVGNAVGSNIFNTLFVIAIVAMVVPIPIERELFKMQFPAMLIFTLISVPMMWTKFKMSRVEGLILLGLYACFISLLY